MKAFFLLLCLLAIILAGSILGWLLRWYREGGRCGAGHIPGAGAVNGAGPGVEQESRAAALSGEAALPDEADARAHGISSGASRSGVAGAVVAGARTGAAMAVADDDDDDDDVAFALPAALSRAETDALSGLESGAAGSRPAGLLDAPIPGYPGDAMSAINGIDDAAAGRIERAGVRYYGQIAAMDADELVWLDREGGLDGKIVENRVAAQAEARASAGDPSLIAALEQARSRAAGGSGAGLSGTGAAAAGIAATTAMRAEGETVQGSATVGAGDMTGDAAREVSAGDAGAVIRADTDADTGTDIDAVEIDTPMSADEIEAARLLESDAPIERPASLLAGPVAGRAPDDLTAIKGIGPVISTRLNDEGVYYFDQIAGFGARDIAWADRTLDFKGRVVRDRWVPQAQGLMDNPDLRGTGPDAATETTEGGAMTSPVAFASTGAAGSDSESGADTVGALRTRFADLGAAAETDDASDDPLHEAPLTDEEREAQALLESGVLLTREPSPDDARFAGLAPDRLQKIKGVGPFIEESLNKEGITRFEQIAAFSGRDLAWADQTLGFRGRVIRDRWIPQARGLMAARDAAQTVGDAGSSSGATGARPQLSEAETEAMALINSEGGFVADASNRPAILLDSAPASGGDDLQQINGIGKKLEALLHDLGVYEFRQIASFGARDIAWVDSKLRFKGRIVRDRWVAQARALMRS